MATTIKDYAVEVVEILKDKGIHGSVTEVVKNNGVLQTGIVLGEEDITVKPTIYIDDKYEQGKTPADIAEYIYDRYDELIDRVPHFDFDINDLNNYEKIKDKIYFTLVNKENNKNELDNIPYTEVLDLIKVYRIRVREDASILIRNDFLDKWGVSKEEIEVVASENTPRLFKGDILDIFSALMGMGVDLSEEGISSLDNDSGMYVVTNETRVNGAGVILYEDVLKLLSKKFDSDIVVIPSSIHEALIIPKTDRMSMEDIKELIQTVNTEQVSLSERLSDHPYLYKRDEDELVAA